MKYTWILLCRVSTKKQEQEWNSLQRQEMRWKKFAEEKQIKLLWVFTETFSWKVETRSITEKAIQTAIEKKVNYLVIPEIDRLSRWGYIVYSAMKDRLEKHWIKLIDTNHIIQEATIVYENDMLDMSKYKWNKEEISKYAEMMIATQAQIEWNKILQRLIPKEIELEQEWYQVRAPKYWFKNKKIKTPNWNRVIQIPNPPFFNWLLEMFEKRAWWVDDKEIIKNLNLRWAVKKSWKPLDVKYMLELIWNPIYAGVIKTKWTWNKPLPTAYDMLPLDLWNKANRGRFFIHKNENNIMIEKNIEIKNKISENIKEWFIFRWILKYQWRVMTPYITKWNVYYRSWRLVKPSFNISEKKLIKLFWEIIKNYSLNEEHKHFLEKFIDEYMNLNIWEIEQKVKDLEKQISSLKEENKTIIKKNAKWLISDNIMEEILLENEKNIEEAEILLIREKSKKQLTSQKVVELSKFLLNTSKLWEKANNKQKSELIKLIVVELSFDTKKELKVAETKLFKLLKNVNFLKWYTWQGSNLRPLA